MNDYIEIEKAGNGYYCHWWTDDDTKERHVCEGKDAFEKLVVFLRQHFESEGQL